MTSYLLRLPEDQYRELKRFSQATGVPVAGVIRSAIDAFLHSGVSCKVDLGGVVTSGAVLILRV